MWAKNPHCKCIFLAQTVMLCIQQMSALRSACAPHKLAGDDSGSGPRIMAYASFNNINEGSWEDVVKK